MSDQQNISPESASYSNMFSSTNSTSAKKLNKAVNCIGSSAKNKQTSNDLNFLIFIHFGIMKNLFEEFSRCSECSSPVKLTHNKNEHKGFSLKLCIKCSVCSACRFSYTSPQYIPLQKSKTVKKAHEINHRTVMAFREIGKGHAGIETFTTMMNMPFSIAFTTYKKINKNLYCAYEKSAEKSTKKAADEVRQIININACSNDIVDCHISIDETWQKRGYSSLNGVVSAISKDNKKVLDYYTMSKFCKSCEIWSKIKGSAGYELWKTRHKCAINHHESSGAMESAGAIAIFCSSLSKFNLRYSHYIGDGDTKAYSKVREARPYGETLIPEKLECLGHVQKRLGTRLRNLRAIKKKRKVE
jgi:hypothetical protein